MYTEHGILAVCMFLTSSALLGAWLGTAYMYEALRTVSQHIWLRAVSVLLVMEVREPVVRAAVEAVRDGRGAVGWA